MKIPINSSLRVNRNRFKKIALSGLGIFVLGLLLFVSYGFIKWKTYIWFPTHFFSAPGVEFPRSRETPVHFFLIIVDHYEPGQGSRGIERNREWLNRYRLFSQRHRDDQGRPLQHTWFFPLERFDENIMADLSQMVKEGYGEVELHWHHSFDTPESFEAKLREGIKRFNSHGALISEGGKVAFAFIHGNWGLDNSMGPKLCGVNNELVILARNGCYADFTFPAIGVDAQPKKINSIYYAKDTPAAKSYDDGIDMEVGKESAGDLLIFEGPMGYELFSGFLRHTWSPFYLEYGGIENDPKPAPFRVKNWIDLSVAIKGRPEWRFIKLYTHGQQSANSFFGREMETTLTALKREISNRGYRLHYVTAREAYNVAKAAEAGLMGDPTQYYDSLIPPPKNRNNYKQSAILTLPN
jgi:hypothetical protein